MKAIAIVAGLFVAICLFFIFIGFPYDYKHEYYEMEETNLEFENLEISVRLVESASKYILGAPVITGAPFRLSINVYGDKEKDKKLILNSASAQNESGEIFTFIEKPIVAEFIAHSIWRTFLYPKTAIMPKFNKGEKLIVTIDLSLETISGTKRKKFIVPFTAMRNEGSGMFPLIAPLFS